MWRRQIPRYDDSDEDYMCVKLSQPFKPVRVCRVVLSASGLDRSGRRHVYPASARARASNITPG